MPPATQADIRNDVLVKISELSKGDIVLQEIGTEIAIAESGLKNIPNYLYDGEKGKYTAFGIFQITRATYGNFCGSNTIERKEIDKNIECGMKILKDDGFSHWDESKYLWYGVLSKEARLRISMDISECSEDIVKPKMVTFAGGKIRVDNLGNVLDKNLKIWYNLDNSEIPFI